MIAWFHDIAELRWEGSDAATFSESGSGRRTPITKTEFFEWLKTHPPQEYRGFAPLPHEPPIEGFYYCPCKLPVSDGSKLRELLAHLNPESEVDRALLLAAIVTPGWGGEPGTRPALALVANDRGAGKTATVTAITDLLWGGVITVKPGEEW